MTKDHMIIWAILIGAFFLYTKTSQETFIFVVLSGLIVGGIVYSLKNDMYKSMRISQLKKNRTEQKEDGLPEKVIKFENVAGIEEVKEELKEIVDFLKNPEKYTTIGAKIPKGVLLIGPPGVGKTLLAKAVSGEASVPFYSMVGSEFVEKWVGVGASRIRKLFNKARIKTPSIIFIDEIDSLGKRGSVFIDGGTQEHDQTINQLLSEMDGFDKNQGIIVIAATNREDKIDTALLRPGRFDRKVYVNPPDIRGREEILKVHTKEVKLNETVDLAMLAKLTPGSTGADLANLVNEAALKAAKDGKESIGLAEFEFAKDKILLGRENKSLSSIMTPEEKRVVAIHEAGHALIALLMPENDPLYKVSIVPGGRALGITSQLPEKDRYNVSESYLAENLSILYGGRVAEEIVFGKVTAGAQNDIERASELARTMVCQLGMSELGPFSFDKKSDGFLSIQSEQTQREVDLEIRRVLKKAYDNAKSLISTHRDKLLKIADALMEKEKLERDEIEALIKEP